jgi:hypothetical protein
MDASELLAMLWTIMQGLHDQGINICSYAVDGSSVERSVQRELLTRATRTQIYKFVRPVAGKAHTTFEIPLHFYGQRAICNIQDPSHGRKTFRNNAFSGARCLTFPRGVVMFSQFRAIAFEKGPLYNRDVEKLDRQDDAAACRLFSADTIEWLLNNHPEQLEAVIYLFIGGELSDAYLNKEMEPITRLESMFLARYFHEFWEKFIHRTGYRKREYFVSPEAADITRTLCDGLLQLVLIYRDHTDRSYPFLPWLLTTEPCEHIYGLSRKNVKDFDMLDFHYMVPKLFLSLREAAFSDRFVDGKARAKGYNHAHLDKRAINMRNLSIYPSDQEINAASIRAYEKAADLWAQLGVSAEQLESPQDTRLPNIGSWFNDMNHSLSSFTKDDFSDDGVDNEDDALSESDENAPVGLLDVEDVEFETESEREDLMGKRFAYIATSIDRKMKV